MEKHLTDEELIQYINNKDIFSKDVLRDIEAHLYIKKCSVCISRTDEIRELNRKLLLKENTEELETFSVCQQSDLVHKYISGKMNGREKEAFTEHLLICDECRELSAVLSMETSNLQEGVNVFENTWKMINQGFYKLTEPLILYTEKINGGNPGTASVVYRDDTEFDEKDSITLELPENYGKVRFQFDKNKKNNSKIFIELVEIKEKNLLLEVYDSAGHLLISQESSGMIACSVTQGAGVVIINKKYEIPFEYSDNKQI